MLHCSFFESATIGLPWLPEFFLSQSDGIGEENPLEQAVEFFDKAGPMGCRFIFLESDFDGSSQNAGPGSGGQGVSFSSNFFFVSIFVVILLYCYFRMFGIFPLFIVEISQKIWNVRKLRKGHLCFSKLREFPTEIGVFAGNIR